MARVSVWAVVGLVLVGWLALSAVVGLAVGAMIRRRDEQVAPEPGAESRVDGPGPLADDH